MSRPPLSVKPDLTPLPEEAPLLLHRTSKLGEGAYGTVYKAVVVSLGMTIAIKEFRVSSSDDHKAVKVVNEEVKIMQQLRHKHIINIFGTLVMPHGLVVLMEYAEGNSLRHLMGEIGALGPELIQKYATQLCQAIAYCHNSGVVHRDIKCRNLLINTDGDLKVADFGSAKSSESAAEKGAVESFTPLWAAPELLTSSDYTDKVDTWSIGCTLIEMATGRDPWPEQAFPNHLIAMMQITSSDILPAIPTTLPPLAQHFISLCLQRDVSRRPRVSDLLRHPWLTTPSAISAGLSDSIDGTSLGAVLQLQRLLETRGVDGNPWT